jgi:hypothetical protein
MFSSRDAYDAHALDLMCIRERVGVYVETL